MVAPMALVRKRYMLGNDNGDWSTVTAFFPRHA